MSDKFVTLVSPTPSVEITFNDNSKVLINTDSVYCVRYKKNIFKPNSIDTTSNNITIDYGSSNINILDKYNHDIISIKGRVIDIITKQPNIPDTIKLDCSSLMKSNIVDIKLFDIVDITPQ